MVTVAGRYGYREASVSRVIREAGASRATFYEYFDGKDDCFGAARRDLAAAFETEVEELGGTLEAVVATVLAWAEERPAAVRFLTIETLAAPPPIREEHERFLERIASGAEAGRASVEPLAVPARLLAGGILGTAGMRAFRGETARLPALLNALLGWLGAYAPGSALVAQAARAPAGLDLPPPIGDVLDDGPLPRGRNALPPTVVAESQRRRVIAAVARLCREKGYASFTVSDLVATASTTREVFYEQFRGKEDAFLATQAFGLEQSVSIAAGRFFSEDSWPDRVWNGLAAMLSYVASQPDLVYVDLVESYAAGPAAVRRSFENRMAFTLFLEQGFHLSPEAEALPRVWAEAVAGAIHELMRSEVLAGRSAEVATLLPLAAFLALAPFLGADAARQLIASRVSGAAT